jgi:ABC-type multidrug transport system fused ATPase/permease subunit
LQYLTSSIAKFSSSSSEIHNEYIKKYFDEIVAKKSSKLDLIFFDSTDYYDKLGNITRDSTALEIYSWSLVTGFGTIIKLVSCIVLLYKVNVFYGIILLLSFLPSLFYEKKYSKFVYGWQTQNVNTERKRFYIMDLLTTKSFAKDIRINRMSDHLINKYKTISDKWIKEKSIMIKKKTFVVGMVSLLPNIFLAIVLLTIIYKIVNGKLSVGDFILYQGLLFELIGALLMFVDSFTLAYDNILRIVTLKEFLNWENVIIDNGRKKLESDFTIVFKNVWFKYPNNDEYTLKNISFEINSKEKVALVGINGSGKSTIIKLLLRFYDVTKGEILINGFNIKEYLIDELQKKFSVLFQDFANFAFSLRENIYLSRLENRFDELKIVESCDKSGVNSFINKLSNGLDTYLTRQFESQGCELSGGEWQKIAIARTFFRDADIVILDEPSSSLDAEAEDYMFKRFEELSENKGCILISHRLSNIISSNKIIVIENGILLGIGSHEELIKNNQRYSHLYNMQANKYFV